jgi:hypothetical protein
MDSAVPRHPLLVMLPAVLADTAVFVGGVAAVVEIIPTRCYQGILECCRPLFVGPGEAPYLIGAQAQLAKHGSEWLAGIDRLQKLLSCISGKPLMRSAPTACPGVVALESAALLTATSCVPSRDGAVRRTIAAPPTLRVCKVTSLQQLLNRPGRLSD